MKKTFIVSMLVLLVPALVFAYFQPATLINGTSRIAVTTQEMAQQYFGMGYVLEGTKPVQKVCDCENLGAVTEHKVRQYFDAGLSYGGYLATTSSMTTYTMTTKEFRPDISTIVWTPSATTTLTIASTTLKSLVPKIGDVANLYFLNAATTASARTITFAAGIGLDLQMAEATGGDLVLAGKNWAKMTIIKTSNSETAVIFDEMTPAD